MTRFLVASAPRSATGYASALFTELGLPTGHEGIYDLFHHGDWADDYPGESSWLAAPFIAGLPADVIVLHQRRDTVAAAESLARHGFFNPGNPYRTFAERWTAGRPNLPLLDRAADFIGQWHRLIGDQLAGRVSISYDVSDLDGLLGRLCAFLDHNPTAAQTKAARAVPLNLNTNRDAPVRMVFAGDVSSSVTYGECAALARIAQDQTVLEVGSWLGRSTIALASTAKHVTAVDWHHGDFYAGEEDTYERFRQNLDLYGVSNVEVVVAKIEDIAEQLPGGFDGVFVDAAHDAESVAAHWLVAREKVRPGGWIAFHDYGRFGVTEVLDGVGAQWEFVESLAITRIEEAA